MSWISESVSGFRCDIYLPIDAREKRLVDAIHGERSIGEIAGDEHRDFCRALFQRLWWHDQVVFDGSRRREARRFHA